MTTPTPLPPGVTRNSEPCWVLVYADGKPYESHDGAPHFADAEDAQKCADDLRDEDDPDELPKPQVLPGPCHHVTTLCGYTLDEEEWIFHFDSAQEAFDTATKSYAWRFVGDGIACSEDAGCSNCDESAARREQGCGPVLLPVPVAVGQQPLIEVVALEAS